MLEKKLHGFHGFHPLHFTLNRITTAGVLEELPFSLGRGEQCGPEGCPGHLTESGAHPSNAIHCSSVAITFLGMGVGEGAGCSGPSFASWGIVLHQACDGQGVPFPRADFATEKQWRR